LYYQKVSSKGEVTSTIKDITYANMDNGKFVDFGVRLSPDKNKILVKSTYLADKKTKTYKTDFVILDSKLMTKIDTKTVNQRVFSYARIFKSGGFEIDNQNNIYFAYTDIGDNTLRDFAKKLYIGVFVSSSKEPKITEFSFGQSTFRDVKISSISDNVLIVGGYLDCFTKVGKKLEAKEVLFSYKIDLVNSMGVSKVVNLSDKDFLLNNKYLLDYDPVYYIQEYKLDYIIPVNNEIYYVYQNLTESYCVQSTIVTKNSSGTIIDSDDIGAACYEYRDIYVTKQNSEGKFQWTKKIVVYNSRSLGVSHFYKHYIVVPTIDNINVFYIENEKNFASYNKPDYEKNFYINSNVGGANCVCSAISTTDGTVNHFLAFKNSDYWYIPCLRVYPNYNDPYWSENLLMGKNNNFYLYNEGDNKGRFSRLTLSK
jgi:hypothetical protein